MAANNSRMLRRPFDACTYAPAATLCGNERGACAQACAILKELQGRMRPCAALQATRGTVWPGGPPHHGSGHRHRRRRRRKDLHPAAGPSARGHGTSRHARGIHGPVFCGKARGGLWGRASRRPLPPHHGACAGRPRCPGYLHSRHPCDQRHPAGPGRLQHVLPPGPALPLRGVRRLGARLLDRRYGGLGLHP